jgi:hypothetical protein
MYRKGVVVGFLAGAMTAVALMILSTVGEEVPRAAAQEVSSAFRPVPEAQPAQEKVEAVEIRAVPAGQLPAPATPRYQIDAWAYLGAPGYPSSHGAYVLDTHSGEVWSIGQSGRPKKVGKVGPE